MNLYHYKYFLDAAENLSMIKAAQINRVTHSAISQAIRKLEEQIGIKLIAHEKKKFILTEAGVKLKEKVPDLLSHLSTISDSIKSDSLIEGKIQIISTMSFAQGFLPTLISDFQKKYPKVTFHIHIGNSIAARRALEDGTCDFAICSKDNVMSGLNSEPLLEGKFVLASTKKNTKKNPLAVIIGDKGKEVDHFYSFYHSVKGRKELSDIPIMEMRSWDLGSRFALQGQYWVYVPDFVLNYQKDLVSIQTSMPKDNYEISVFWPKNQNQSKLLVTFLGEVHSTIRQ